MATQEGLTAALERENAAWNVVKERLPGTARHEPILWSNWLDAAQAVALEQRRLKKPPESPGSVKGLWIAFLQGLRTSANHPG